MKKLYTLILAALLFSSSGKAQLSLTKAANEPVIGDVQRTKSFDSTTAIPRNTGTAQVWNFTSLATNTINVVINTYTTPASITGGVSFTNANIAATTGTNSNFYKSGISTFELAGSKINTLTLNFSNTAILSSWPMPFGYSNTDLAAGTVTAFGFPGNFTGTIITNVTGTGTLQLPSGITFTNALQVKADLTTIATVTIPFVGTLTSTVLATTYQYFDISQKFPVLTHNIQTVKTNTSSNTAITVDINNNLFAGINEYTNSVSNLNLYPNPSNGNLFVSLNNENSENVSVEISNCIGQVVKKVSLENTKGVMTNSIDLNGLNNGIYFVKTIVGNKSSTKKLILE